MRCQVGASARETSVIPETHFLWHVLGQKQHFYGEINSSWGYQVSNSCGMVHSHPSENEGKLSLVSSLSCCIAKVQSLMIVVSIGGVDLAQAAPFDLTVGIKVFDQVSDAYKVEPPIYQTFHQKFDIEYGENSFVFLNRFHQRSDAYDLYENARFCEKGSKVFKRLIGFSIVTGTVK